jgi:putative transposase
MPNEGAYSPGRCHRPDADAGQGHLRAVLEEYVAHYNQHRPHRARNLRPPDSGEITTAPVTDLATARIRRHKVLGGLIHEYERAA